MHNKVDKPIKQKTVYYMKESENLNNVETRALNIFAVSGRFLLSPFIFLWGIFMLAAGTLFPLPLLVMYSFIGFIIEPFIYLFRLSGSEINGIEPFIQTEYIMLSHLLGLTIYIWGAPVIVINYILTGQVWTGD